MLVLAAVAAPAMPGAAAQSEEARRILTEAQEACRGVDTATYDARFKKANSRSSVAVKSPATATNTPTLNIVRYLSDFFT